MKTIYYFQWIELINILNVIYDAELILESNNTYIDLYDGYFNDNLNFFSVKLKSSEKWIYTNSDNANSDLLHFHLTN